MTLAFDQSLRRSRGSYALSLHTLAQLGGHSGIHLNGRAVLALLQDADRQISSSRSDLQYHVRCAQVGLVDDTAGAKRISCEGRHRGKPGTNPWATLRDSQTVSRSSTAPMRGPWHAQRVLENVLAELSRVEDGVESSLAAGRLSVLFGCSRRSGSMSMTEAFTRSARHCSSTQRVSRPNLSTKKGADDTGLPRCSLAATSSTVDNHR